MGESDFTPPPVYTSGAVPVSPSAAPGWYPDPAGSARQRYFDGTRWTEHYTAYQPMPRKSGMRTALTVFGVIAALVVAVAINGAMKDTPSKSTALDASSSNVAPAGSAVRDGKFEFNVMNVVRSPYAGDRKNRYLTEKAQGEFVVVTLLVTNIGDRAQSFFGQNQKLIDKSGREYSANSSADIAVNGYVGDINPGNSVQVELAFDVPKGTTVEAMEVHDSMVSGGARVALTGQGW